MSDQTMTVGITGPRRRAPWRGAVMVLMIAGIVLSICLILLGLTDDFLVDWLRSIRRLRPDWLKIPAARSCVLQRRESRLAQTGLRVAEEYLSKRESGAK